MWCWGFGSSVSSSAAQKNAAEALGAERKLHHRRLGRPNDNVCCWQAARRNGAFCDRDRFVLKDHPHPKVHDLPNQLAHGVCDGVTYGLPGGVLFFLMYDRRTHGREVHAIRFA
jgi:hypothetical protein